MLVHIRGSKGFEMAIVTYTISVAMEEKKRTHSE